MSKPPMPTPKKIIVADYELPNPEDLAPAAALAGAAIQAAEAHTDLPSQEATGAASTEPEFTMPLESEGISDDRLAQVGSILQASALTSNAPTWAETSEPSEPNTFNVRLYHYIADNGEYVSLFPAESPELMDEMLEHGMVRTYKTAHQIKHNIKDKELEHRALALFHGEVSARTELTRRGFGRNWE